MLRTGGGTGTAADGLGARCRRDPGRRKPGGRHRDPGPCLCTLVELFELVSCHGAGAAFHLGKHPGPAAPGKAPGALAAGILPERSQGGGASCSSVQPSAAAARCTAAAVGRNKRRESWNIKIYNWTKTCRNTAGR